MWFLIVAAAVSLLLSVYLFWYSVINNSIRGRLSNMFSMVFLVNAVVILIAAFVK